jgi:hypothetical protein
VAGQHVDGHLEILQSGLVQREHVGKRVVAGRDERIGVLRDTGFGEKGSDVGPAALGGHDDCRLGPAPIGQRYISPNYTSKIDVSHPNAALYILYTSPHVWSEGCILYIKTDV